MTEWRSIDTDEPPEGEIVDLWVCEADGTGERWADVQFHRGPSEQLVIFGKGENRVVSLYENAQYASHWIPAPEPPINDLGDHPF